MSNQEKASGQLLTKGEKTHLRLRAVAAAEFAQRGFHNTKVSDIVQASGLSQPTFYAYFESKEAAYEELVGEFRKRLEDLTGTLLIETSMSQPDLLKSVARSFLRFFDFLAEDNDLTQIGFFQPPGCTQTKAGLASWIGRNIAKEQAIGLFRSDISSTLIGKCFVGMIDQMARDPMDAEQRTETAHACALLLCDGHWRRTDS
ncbi:TetR/AcrR family transcriptional regulator [Pseudomonas sp. dw_358]|uniref:TetR/AcrR family transcriptional regulator n=1 Tax=Pseudomonas sp. dw_358 TaxID=2720083 RepID=UPI001BD5D191|nr:TetR/AcrR family transcriptional regulator [Pseudomonas sp. dw_358]